MFSCLQLVELSKAQDIEAGDGTTSVVVIAGSLLEAAERLLQKGIHPTLISDAFQKAAMKAVEILTNMSIPVDLQDKQSLIRAAATSLNSKVYLKIVIHNYKFAKFTKLKLCNSLFFFEVVFQQSSLLAPLAVDAVLKVTEEGKESVVDLNVRDI